MISIQDHRAFQAARAVRYVASPNIGGTMKPDFIVLHDTASGLDASGPISWLTNPASKVSAHVVIGRDGSITQLVPFNRKAWHAGQSIWKGRSLLNGFSIGIEIVNPGKMQKIAPNRYKALATIDTDRDPSLRVEQRATRAHGDGFWLDYTPAQVQAVQDLCRALVIEYGCQDILTHWQISPGRKVDTNPLFPLDRVKAAALVARPVALAGDGGGATDESDGGEGDDFAAPVGKPDTDESAGGWPWTRLYRSRIVQTALGLITSSFGAVLAFLSDWRVLGMLCLLAIIVGSFVIIYRRSKVQ